MFGYPDETLSLVFDIGKIFVYKHCFCYFNVQNVKKEFFVSPANGSLVGILITIGDVTDIFAMLLRL